MKYHIIDRLDIFKSPLAREIIQFWSLILTPDLEGWKIITVDTITPGMKGTYKYNPHHIRIKIQFFSPLVEDMSRPKLMEILQFILGESLLAIETIGSHHDGNGYWIIIKAPSHESLWIPIK